ncbi:MAG: 23S rRNA (uracil(1939)-C(5))-methyltransferase RlmD [Vulcanococcus sp.]
MKTKQVPLGTVIEFSISGVGHDGQGVGRWEDTAVFVPGVLAGERVVARVKRSAKRHLEAELVGVQDPSPHRQKPACILADHCGGCSLQHASSAAQLEIKADIVRQSLQRLAKLEAPVHETWGCSHGLGYRNRALIPLERRDEGSPRAGYSGRGSHRIVNMNRCPVLDPRIDELIAPLKEELEASRWPVDVNLSGSGGLRHLGLRVGHHSGEVLITLISSHHKLPGLEERAQDWLKRWPQVVGVTLNVQPKASNVVMGSDSRLLAGRSWLLETFAGVDLQIAPETFFQVNTAQAERLVAPLQAFFEAGSSGTVIDAYCGIGTFSLPLAKNGLQVLGLELHGASVEQAQANAERNGIGTAFFEQADVASVLADRLRMAGSLLVDPPRKGLSAEALAAIQESKPERIAYISCNPSTLARDLAQLCGDGSYQLLSVQPVDFFPQTSHVECLALLVRL